MKSTERHKLKENEVASLLARSVSWFAPRLTMIVSAAGVLLILFIAFVIMHHQGIQKNLRAGRNISATLADVTGGNMSEAGADKIAVMEDLADKYGSTKNGAKLLFDLGTYYAERGEDAVSAEYFRRSSKHLMEKGRAYVAAAGQYQNLGEFEKAEEMLLKVGRDDPAYENALYLRYIGALKTDDLKTAEAVAAELKSSFGDKSVYKDMTSLREVL